MSETSSSNDFLSNAKAIVEEQISNEQFGVSELAEAMNMSRSNLLRKIKKHTGASVSQFIRQIRLEEADKLLQETQLTVSEISHQVGFSNTSYFIKCYREDFGFPPGEARKIIEEESKNQLDLEFPYEEEPSNSKSFFQMHGNKLLIAVTLIVILMISFLWKDQGNSVNSVTSDKSIAVMPFKNMSTDSMNLYFVNGLMEASLNNLQRIKDLRVISRTSAEKYRNTQLSATEIGEELRVRYLVEGSGQKVGDEVLLNIQLIDATTDTPIWTQQYKDKLTDVFTLQNTVAKKIALAIEANVTPAELAQIDKKPTENLVAYDYYLKGIESQQKGTEEGRLKSVEWFQKAIEEDETFAIAYAQTAISYFFLDLYKIEKKYTVQINENADKALLYDSKSDLSLIAKAVYYISNKEFNLAIPHLEKALEYNPNSSSVVLILADLYARALPNTAKYLKYALKGVQLDIQANDSIGKSFIYLTLSNALVQNGFVQKSYAYILKAYSYNKNNPYVPYLRTYIEYALNKNIKRTTAKLIDEYEKDTLRGDIVQEIGKMYYFQEEYQKAYEYYSKYVALRGDNQIDLFPQENLKIGIVYEKLGYNEEAKQFFDAYDEYCKNDTSIYKPASLGIKYLYEGDKDAAIEQYQLFAQNGEFQYWMVLFMEQDPLMNDLSTHPKYKETIRMIFDKFEENHQEVKKMLEENDLL